MIARNQNTHQERQERERNDTTTPNSHRGPGHETYEEKLERYRRGWDQELERDFYK
jgi:hypothetical protein